MNANWGLVPVAPKARGGPGKRERREAAYRAGLDAFGSWLEELQGRRTADRLTRAAGSPRGAGVRLIRATSCRRRGRGGTRARRRMVHGRMTDARPRRTVDLRSDTVTRPSPAMRRAMAEAEVGDDVYGEDPTVAPARGGHVAELTGKEAGLFVPSGTMGNQVALAAHTTRGVEVIAPEGAHVYEYELGSMAALAGLMPRLVPAPGGVPDPEACAAR